MPTYEYRCQKCGRTFERIEHMSEHGAAPPLCPRCESGEVEQVMSAFVAHTSKKS